MAISTSSMKCGSSYSHARQISDLHSQNSCKKKTYRYIRLKKSLQGHPACRYCFPSFLFTLRQINKPDNILETFRSLNIPREEVAQCIGGGDVFLLQFGTPLCPRGGERLEFFCGRESDAQLDTFYKNILMSAKRTNLQPESRQETHGRYPSAVLLPTLYTSPPVNSLAQNVSVGASVTVFSFPARP